MSYVTANPEMMTAAASDLASIGSNVDAARMVAAARTTSVIPAAADEVSAGIAHLFSQHAQDYQAMAGKAAAFQEQFVQHLTAGAFSYASVEANNAALLNGLNVVSDWFVNYIANTPPQQLLADGVGVLIDLGLLATAPVWLPIVGGGALIVLAAAALDLFLTGHSFLWGLFPVPFPVFPFGPNFNTFGTCPNL
jgi:predicted RecA/RadA family phage recombinase